MEPDVSFVGIQLLPGKPVSVNDDEESENQIWTLHITQFALAKQPKAGRNVVSIIKDDGRQFVLGTLEKGRCEQFQADFMISESVRLVVDGDSEVHLTGYKTTTELLDPEAEELVGDSDEDEDEDDEDFENELRRRAALANGGDEDDDEDEEESDEEDEEAPDAVPLKGLTPKQQADKLLKQIEAEQRQQAGDDSEDEDDVDEEDLGEDDDDDVEDAALGTGLADMEADDDSDDEDDEEEEEEAAPPPKAKAKAKRPAAAEAKRPAPATPAAPSAKKAKTEAKTPAGGEGAGDAAWLRDIRAYVAKEGPTSLSTIGSAVKKPPGTASKLGKLLRGAPGFEVGADNVVKLKK